MLKHKKKKQILFNFIYNFPAIKGAAGGDRPVNPIHGLKFLEVETDFAFEGILPLNSKAVRRMKKY